jgi:hypothetical protein
MSASFLQRLWQQVCGNDALRRAADEMMIKVIIINHHNNKKMSEPNSNSIVPAVAAAATAPDDDDNNNSVSLGYLWDTLQDEFTNMGRALACPLCLSTYHDAVQLPCVHTYCRSCLEQALSQGPPRCPT